MAFTPRRREASFGTPLTPLIDVTFLLLIFFVCANAWSHADTSELLELPSPIRSGLTHGEEERPRLTINLRRDGTIVVAGRTMRPDVLGQVLASEHRKHGDRLEIVIRAHQEAPYARTQELLNLCSEAGVKEVRFAVLREKH
jgi:biopolymer transport protein ExbD